MNTHMGVWIDHTKAIIVSVSDKGDDLHVIESNVSRHVWPVPGTQESAPNGRRDITPDDIKDRQYGAHLNSYYQSVSDHLRNAQEILILGPGEPKNELRKLLQKEGMGPRIQDIKVADKMTYRQIISRVKKYFMAGAPV